MSRAFPRRASALALSAGLVLLSVAASLAVALRPVPGAPVLAWFAPGEAAALRAAVAGGLPVAPGPAGSVLVRGEADLAARLAAAGAWLVLRADTLGGCLMPSLRQG
jgi:hypothetical protein